MTHAIVACARGWLGTRFHHQGRLKKSAAHKGGVDCLGLLAGIAAEMKLCGTNGSFLADFDERDYSHLPDAARLRQRLATVLTPIPVDRISAGDILLLKIDGHPQHLAIVSELENGLGIIHAYAPARAVVEHALDSYWQERVEAAYRLS